MKSFAWSVAVLGVCMSFVAAGGDAAEGLWRLTIGPAVNVGVRAKFCARPQAVAGRLPRTPGLAGVSKAEAEERARRGLHDDGAFVDPDSSVELPDRTWNWWAPESAYADQTLTLRNAYVDSSFEEAVKAVYDADERVAPGVSLELSRALCRDEKRGWGVDVSILASWFRRDSILKAGGDVYERTDLEESGALLTRYGDGRLILTDRSKHNGGYGAGSFAGPGPLLDLSTKKTEWESAVSSSSVRARVSAEGDYQEFEWALVARPYYDCADWLRVYGTVGAAVSYLRFDYSFRASSDGKTVLRESRTYDDWDVYALAGLGVLARLGDWSVSADFMTRLWADSLTFDAASARGSVSRGDWMFRLGVGYAF
jgi:opacity protein-like surface antigen